MTSPHRRPAGTPTGGQFASGSQERAAVSLDIAAPYGEESPWNADPARREDLERGLAEQLASTPWGRSDSRQLARRVFEGAAMYRGVPVEEFVDCPAGAEAAERGDDALHSAEQSAMAEPVSDARRAQVVYDAVLPIIDAVQARTFTPSGFRSARPAGEPGQADRGDDRDETIDSPPTRREVDEAKAMLDLHTPVRPMYRGDWERLNGGTGPTVAQHRAHLAEMGESRAAREQARDHYQQLLAAWEASDKSQDDEDRSVHCGNCGAWYDRFEGRCHVCGES